MKRLLRISIEGFKTFAGKTQLSLGDGMTAVVGPNGSGKSNLIDAVAWAVGSRSWKTLRGDGMEDVIFHGGVREKAAPLARVTIGFDNSDRLLGIDFSEVEITREIARGGGSRMLVNGVESRLKDVQNLLSGTGLVGGFSLIRQGSVDKLILASPEDIRRWIEESANIAAYRSRKQEAVARLNKVEAQGAEAERRHTALRRELGQVKARAERARSRRELEARRDVLEQTLNARERFRLEEVLQALELDLAARREDGRTLADRRQKVVDRRQRLVEELESLGSGDPEPTPPEAAQEVLDGAGVQEKAERIRGASASLGAAADDLVREGPGSWSEVSGRLEEVAAILQDIRSPGSTFSGPPARSADYAPRLAELRHSSTHVEELDRDCAREASALADLQCEKARLEERRAALAPCESLSPNTLPDITVDQARAELVTVEGELARVGPVDETALAREQEIGREMEELVPVLEDLASARSQLGAFIRQMEGFTTQIFNHTMERVEARFRNYFGILFHGGDARLALLEPADADPDQRLDEAAPGVEVRIKLPRKPETSLTLLSGGERSLAGLALILALAGGDPEDAQEKGRLLILDEVDAALDETNAARLACLLHELQESHQILCVSHNRLTMHQASRLIGVTCSGASVSTIVRVDLNGLAPEGRLSRQQGGGNPADRQSTRSSESCVSEAS